MGEHGGAVFLDVVIQPDPTLGPGQEIRQRGLTVLKRIAAKIVAVQLDNVECV